jgi:hypothetical protein
MLLGGFGGWICSVKDVVHANLVGNRRMEEYMDAPRTDIAA